MIEAGVTVLDQPFAAKGNLATSGGCMSSQYLAAWVIAKIAGRESAENALWYVAPVGEKDVFTAHSMSVIEPFL